ncbi:MAG: sensor histidine kinase, partial [Mycobacteriales bacterium]
THVVLALVLVGSAGLLAAAASGWFLARRAVRPLAAALTRQREFVADASHELRTPLTLLSTRAQLLHRRLAAAGDDRTAVRDANSLVEDAARLADVVEDLLLAADPRGDAFPEQIDLGHLAAQVADSAAPYADVQSVAIRLELAPAPVSANATAVRRAVLALLDNAIGHTPPGGTVTVGTGTAPGIAHVTVSDTGPGLDHRGADRLFRRFASGDQRASRRGYGLGLALVRDIAARHGGTIRALDPPGGIGACFRLALPAATPQRASAPPPSETAHDRHVQQGSGDN